MKIKFTIDTEDGLDPVEPLGDIEIVCYDGSAIKDELIFIDSALLSLATGLFEIKNQSSFSSEIFDEPNPFNFSKTQSGYQIEYMGQKVLFRNINKVRKELVGKVYELKRICFKPGTSEFNSYFTEIEDVINKIEKKL